MSETKKKPLDYRTPVAPARRAWFMPSRSQKKVMLWALGILCVMLVCGLVSFLSWYLPFQQNLRKATEHAAKLRVAVAGDARFVDVNFEEFTGGNGTLLISGGVKSQSDLSAVRQIVGGSNPPVRIGWLVSVYSAKTTRPAPAGFGG